MKLLDSLLNKGKQINLHDKSMITRMRLTDLRETTFIAGDSVLRDGRNRPYNKPNS